MGIEAGPFYMAICSQVATLAICQYIYLITFLSFISVELSVEVKPGARLV